MTIKQFRTKAVLDSLTDEEIAKLAKVALGMPVPDSELTSLEDNHLVFFDSEEPGPHLTPEGHRVISLRISELARLHGTGPAHDKETVMRLGTNHAKAVAGENLTIEKESFWSLDTRRMENIIFGFVFATESGVKGMYHASFLRKTTGEEPWMFAYDWMRIALGSFYVVCTNHGEDAVKRLKENGGLVPQGSEGDSVLDPKSSSARASAGDPQPDGDRRGDEGELIGN